ncbi:MAG: LrgB family protein, partial [Beijerinckiaceae bacterium]
MREFTNLWVYLSASPLLWLTTTIAVYLAADFISERFRRHPLANPVAISIVVLAALLTVTGTSYAVFFNGAQFIHFLLGPATVALAVPLWRNRKLVQRYALPVLVALSVGSIFAVLSAVLLAKLLGAPANVVASLAPKSTTAGIAMAIAESSGGQPGLTAGLVIATGVLGAIIVSGWLRLLRIQDQAAIGFAAGLTSHGIGTARAFQ